MKQSVFAMLIGTSRSTVSRAVKSGILQGYGKDHEVIEKEALIAFKKIGKLDKEGKYISRQAKPFENGQELKQESKEALLSLDGEIKTSAMSPDDMKALADQQRIDRENMPKVDLDEEEEGTFNTPVGAFPDELARLLIEVEDPSKRVGIIKDFWAGKIQKQKFLREKSELIPINEAKAVMEFLFHPISKNMDNLHVDLKARFPDVPLEAIDWVSNTINSMKMSVQEYEWEL